MTRPDVAFPAQPRDELDRSVSQTLSRGLAVLELLAAEGKALTAQQIATALGLSRPVVYRLLRTLAQHHLLSTEAGDEVVYALAAEAGSPRWRCARGRACAGHLATARGHLLPAAPPAGRAARAAAEDRHHP
jgi:DNA-binding transcriptional ArsR family regulator